MSDYREVETKYSAKDIKLEDFKSLVDKLKPRWQEAASWDDYFIHKTDKDDFQRYRHMDGKGQLTSKEKTVDINNNDRIEYNIELGNNRYETVAAWLESKKYKHNFRVFKYCAIAWLDRIDLVYYITYDEEMRELDRFIEIEALETYQWASKEDAWAEVVKYEKLLEPLGIVPQSRMKKSLLELYRK